MSLIPTQEEIDSIASFVEAVDELEKEPFYTKDEPRGVSIAGKQFTFKLGDRFHFRSALITFRRIWMAKEAENFARVCVILNKHIDREGQLVEYHRKQVQNIAEGNPSFFVPLPSINTKKLINLWLNTVFAHSGLRGQHHHSREEFDKIVGDHGLGTVEYAFRDAVFKLGLCFFEVAQFLARPLMNSWRSEGYTPSFKLGSAFGTKRRERSAEGHIIIRQSSSEFFSEEPYELRFSRILARPAFRNLKDLFEQLELSNRQLLYLSLKHDDIIAIINESNFEFKIDTIDVDWQSNPSAILKNGVKFFCGLSNAGMEKQSMISGTDSEIRTDEQGRDILNEHLCDFREKLMKD